MNKINYDILTEITVKSQTELDMIPLDFKGRIYIEFGTYWNKAVVKNRYMKSVVARGNSSVVAWENSSVEAWGNSSVEAWENSSVEAWENSSVVARENSSVVARGNNSVVARENSSVVARGNNSVEAWENSNINGSHNAQIVDRLSCGRIEITGNARIVYMPKSIEEYCSFYGLEHDKKKGKFYKCVHKQNGRFFSDHDSRFEYVVGKKAIPDRFDNDVNENCGHGIHVAYLQLALDYGRNWNNLAIIEVEAELKDIVVPIGCPGKVRCKEVTVLREVPLEKCGVYGKILAMRLKSVE